MATKLSAADSSFLTAAQQADIQKYKDAYAAAKAANDPDGMQKAHEEAEKIRKSAGYSGGTSGAGYAKLSANIPGGQTAADVEQYLKDYTKQNYSDVRGWTNGYSTAMNTRSKANYIRQQMEANSKAWHTANEADREYLHQQNLELAKLLDDYAGLSFNGEGKDGGQMYDPATGKWSTWNPNVGYGSDASWTQPNIAEAWKEHYGYTDADRAKWDADTSRYHNFVDTRTAARNQVDESSGFTGAYAQFVNGPHSYLLGGAPGGALDSNYHMYMDVAGDGFHDENDGAAYRLPTYDENGNIIKTAPYLKDNNGLTDYSRSHADYTANGLIMPGTASGGSGGGAANMPTGQTAKELSDKQVAYFKKWTEATGGNKGNIPAGAIVSGGSGGGTGQQDYLSQMYDAALQAQLSQLETSHKQNLSDLDASSQKTADQYRESMRQTTGQSAQDAANWRELANAYGLNSGAIGQAALAQNNRLQSDLNTLQAAEGAAQDEIERNRQLLGQQYQAAINEAMANNDTQKAQALYQEAVRVEQQLMQQQQFNAQIALQYAQMAMQQNQWQQEFAYQQQKDAMAAAAAAAKGTQSVVVADDEALYQLYRDAASSANPSNYMANYASNYGFKKTAGLDKGFEEWYKTYNYGAKGNTRNDILSSLRNRISDTAKMGTTMDAVRASQRELIGAYVANGLISADDGEALLAEIGLG